MKTKHILVIAALLATGISRVSAQDTAAKPATNPPAPKILTHDDFKRLLCSQTWTWERPNEKPEVVSFAPNGNATNNTWVARYSIKSPTEVILQIKDKTARLKFSDDYATFTGIDFNKATPVSGSAQGDPKITANAAPTAPAAGTADANADFERRLIGTKWSWSGFHFAFEAGGTTSGDRHFTWKTTRPNTIEYQYSNGFHGTIVFERNLTKAMMNSYKPDDTKESPTLVRDKP